MFGNKKKLVEQLTESGGKIAWATVIEADTRWRSSSSSGFNASMNVTDHMKVTVRVEPDGEPPFEATFSQAFKGSEPMQGWQCKVIYDPGDHDKIAVLEGQVFPPGVSHDQAERSAAMRAGMMEAVKSGNVAGYIEQMKAQAASGAIPGVVMVNGQVVSGGQVAPGAASAQPDVVDQLAKLADLHDRGALTDEEFQAQKAKLLGSS